MDNQPILSLCIPTNGAVEWVLPVIESIYSQGYDNDKFEVVITDNGKDTQLPQHVAKMNYPNLRYRQTTDEGFLNLVTCLKEGKGLFCKMINHRSVMLPDSIKAMVALVERYKEGLPMIYCLNGNDRIDKVVECKSIDEFIQRLSYWASWSAGIGFWQKDLSNFEKLELDEMFPNASLLLGVRQETQYVIWNEPYFKMEDDAGKGGYDVFQTFGVGFLDLLSGLRIKKRISQDTFIKVKRDLYGFLCSIYINEVLLPTKHTFIIQNIKQSMSIYYGPYYYYKMVCSSWIKAPIRRLKYIIKRIIRH